MNAPAKAHEPTMEEILASIRRIISDDDVVKPPLRAPAAEAESLASPAPEPRAGEAAETNGVDDVDAMFAAIDARSGLTPQANAEMTALARTTEDLAADLENDLDVLELTDEIEPASAPEPKRPEPQAGLYTAAPSRTPEAPKPARPLVNSDHLLSAQADESVTNSFGALANTILAGNARTLDDVVRDMLRPMLRAWLDDNLPPLVERLVRQEIERVARGGR